MPYLQYSRFISKKEVLINLLLLLFLLLLLLLLMMLLLLLLLCITVYGALYEQSSLWYSSFIKWGREVGETLSFRCNYGFEPFGVISILKCAVFIFIYPSDAFIF